MLFVTVYTPEYRDIVRRLLDSAARHDLCIFAEAVPSRSSWRQNVLLKLDHLLRCFDWFHGEDIVFLDADAEIANDPTGAIHDVLRRESFDMAMAWTTLGHGVTRPDTGRVGRWHSGTIVMPSNGLRREIVRQAKAIIDAEGLAPRAPEEHAICEAILRMPATCYDLPYSLCHVFDKPNEHGETYIVQHQASRQMASVVGA